MRIAINVEKDGDPRLVEEDIRIALAKVHTLPNLEWEISEWGDDGCFTADSDYQMSGIGGLEELIHLVILEDTGATVSVEVIPGWPPKGWMGGFRREP